MGRSELEHLSREELIALVLRLQRPEKTSRTSSRPPSADRKERREQAKPGGAKPGHEGHSRPLSDDVSERVAHRPDVCPCCRMALARDLPAEEAGIWERIELPRRSGRTWCATTAWRCAAPDAARGPWRR